MRAAVLITALSGCAGAQNLVVNPGFESGNSGFTSDYAYSAGGNCCEGQYTVRAVPSTFNGAFVNPAVPSSPGSVQMMVINGSTVPGLTVWGQMVPAEAGRLYALSVRGFTAVAGGPAVLQFQSGGAGLHAGVSLPGAPGAWLTISAEVRASGSMVDLSIENLNSSRFPNDFCIDDVSMVAVCEADLNGDGAANIFDVLVFFTAFGNGDAAVADVAPVTGPDGLLNIFDVLRFFELFAAGC